MVPKTFTASRSANGQRPLSIWPTPTFEGSCVEPRRPCAISTSALPELGAHQLHPSAGLAHGFHNVRNTEASMSPTERPATILVADDNEANRLLAQGALEDEGYRVVLASGGVEAVAVFERELPD